MVEQIQGLEQRGGSLAGARAGGSAVGAGGTESSAAGAGAGGSSCSRASWNSSPSGYAAAASSGTGPAPFAAAPPAAGGAGGASAGAPAAGCTKARRVRFPTRDMFSSPPTPQEPTNTTSTTSTTRTNSTYISQPAWESPSVGEGSLPSSPSPSLLSFLSCPEPLSQHHYIFSGQPGH